MRSLTEGFSKLYSVRMYYGQISGLMFHTFKIHQRKNAEPESVLRFKTTAKNNNDTVTEARLRGEIYERKVDGTAEGAPKNIFLRISNQLQSITALSMPTNRTVCHIYQFFTREEISFLVNVLWPLLFVCDPLEAISKLIFKLSENEKCSPSKIDNCHVENLTNGTLRIEDWQG